MLWTDSRYMEDTVILLLITFTIAPFQGLFNVFIYLIPVFRKKLKTYRQRKANEKEQQKIDTSARCSKSTTEVSFKNEKKIRSSGIVKEEEEKGEISVVQQQTFYPESNKEEGNGEGDNAHDDHADIGDDECDSDRSGDDHY